LPTSRTFFDIRIIAFRVAAVIPVAGWVLLDGGRRLLDVNGWRYRYGDHGRRIIRVIKRVAPLYKLQITSSIVDSIRLVFIAYSFQKQQLQNCG